MIKLSNPSLIILTVPKKISIEKPVLIVATILKGASVTDPRLLVMYDDHSRLRVSYDTSRNVTSIISYAFDTVRKLRSTTVAHENIDYNTIRRIKKKYRFSAQVIRCVSNVTNEKFDTKRNLISSIHYNITETYATCRYICTQESIFYDTIRSDGTIRVNTSYDTIRDIISNYGIYQCNRIDLGAEIPVDIMLDITGSGYVKIKAGNNYVDFKPQRMTTRYIDIELYVTDEISKAELKIAHVEHSKTITADIKRTGTKVNYGTVFSTKPAIFLALSEYDVKIVEQTNTDVTLQLLKNGELVAGTITFEVKGR